MIQKIETRFPKWAQAVLELQLASYAVEAKLINFDDLPPLKDTVETIQQSDEIFYGFFVRETLAGAISYERQHQTVHICRMMVHPDYFRRGIASSLIQFICDLENDATEITVTTGTNNAPAIHLYKRHGFKEVGKIEVASGIYITKFSKRLAM
ncbi:GNAT family N-acetyltransferase [Anoxybacteroides tepidamans]|uniref:GNAT family N-acetyltransferase n=1 Tax=Anoxybacteroides tepidamans TaxID=265948 RepID=UPI00047F5A8C|nr:GNAT family N-acetyltransferase [Anoxybacillus tepidamans]